jgi:DNA-binding IscR family transcriptional regulator
VLALQITHAIVQRFAKAEKALSLTDLAKQFSLPIQVAQTTLTTLIECGIIVELKSEQGGDAVFQPAQDIDLLTVYTIIERLENQGEKSVPQMEMFENFVKINECFNNRLKTAQENYLLKEL